jgi:hypothetical protein
VADLRPKPAINNFSRRLLKSTSRKPISERSQEYVASVRAKQEKVREELAQKEVAEVSAAPVINERSKRMQRGLKDIITWGEEREARREFRTAVTEMKRDSEVTQRPMICRGSEALFEKMKKQGEWLGRLRLAA